MLLSIKLLMLSDTGVDKGGIVLIIISIVYGSKALAQKPTSNTELTRSHNVRNLLQHTALNINLRQSRLLLAISGSIQLRKTAIPPVVIPHRKTVVPSKTNPLFANVLAISGSIVLRQTTIPSVATPHRKTVVPSKANPLFASALAISRSIVLRKTVIPSEAIAHRKTVVRSNSMFVRLGTDYEIRNGGYFESIKNSANQFISKP